MKISQLFYFWIFIGHRLKYFYTDQVIYRDFGNHIGHIWGSSQRAWMGEHTELERGRSKNLFYLMTANGKQNYGTKKREDTKTVFGVLH